MSRIDAINFYRPDEASNYGREEQRLLNVFVPHIHRSLNIYKKLQMAGARSALLQNSIDALASALVLLNQNGTVRFLNAAAERLLKQCRGLYVRRNRLCAMRHADSLQLERLTKEAIGKNGRRPVGGAVTIQQGLGEQPLQVAAAPLPLNNAGTIVSGLEAAAVLVIHNPSEQTYVPHEIISTMFGLTPAESQLLLALGNGQTLRQFSDEHRVTRNTARTHLKSVFAKTGTSKQSDLVRLLSVVTHSVTWSKR